MKYILIILSFLSILSFQANLITIDLQLNNDKTYIIKNKDDKINFSFDKDSNINIIPQKFLHLIKLIFINNNIMRNCLSTKYKEYDSFYCIENEEKTDLNNIKLNLNFDNFTQTLKFPELFSKKNKFYFFKFYSKPDIASIILGTKKFNQNNHNNLRLLKSNNETEIKNDTDIITNHNEQGKDNNTKKSGIGWLGISLIILLSMIVIYVVYVGFRYYRRKKYQNPSFYYKITEEMFDDITPIE